jgi:endoglycosylceramidase
VLDRILWANMERHVRQQNVTPLLTEFGASDRLANIADLVDRAASHRTGWQYWAYCGCGDPTTTGGNDKQALVFDPQQPPTGSNLKTDKLKVLAIPHPTAVSGTPVSYAFNRTSGRFTLTYSTLKAAGGGRFGDGAQTTIAVPDIHYPNGYTVDVTGGTVVSAPNASELVVEQDGLGTLPIRVIVTRN